jgi:hypothetical protein
MGNGVKPGSGPSCQDNAFRWGIVRPGKRRVNHSTSNLPSTFMRSAGPGTANAIIININPAYKCKSTSSRPGTRRSKIGHRLTQIIIHRLPRLNPLRVPPETPFNWASADYFFIRSVYFRVYPCPIFKNYASGPLLVVRCLFFSTDNKPLTTNIIVTISYELWAISCELWAISYELK